MSTASAPARTSCRRRRLEDDSSQCDGPEHRPHDGAGQYDARQRALEAGVGDEVAALGSVA